MSLFSSVPGAPPDVYDQILLSFGPMPPPVTSSRRKQTHVEIPTVPYTIPDVPPLSGLPSSSDSEPDAVTSNTSPPAVPSTVTSTPVVCKSPNLVYEIPYNMSVVISAFPSSLLPSDPCSSLVWVDPELPPEAEVLPTTVPHNRFLSSENPLVLNCHRDLEYPPLDPKVKHFIGTYPELHDCTSCPPTGRALCGDLGRNENTFACKTGTCFFMSFIPSYHVQECLSCNYFCSTILQKHHYEKQHVGRGVVGGGGFSLFNFPDI